MTGRGWAGAVATAAVGAAATGAASLGFGYGLGVINWTESASRAWTESLTWATWISATSTIVGAIVADRLHRRPAAPGTADGPSPASGPPPDTTGPAAPATDPAVADPVGDDHRHDRLRRPALAAAAAVGALVAVALVVVPARLADPGIEASAQLVAAGYAAGGVIIGLVLAVGALTARAVAANLLATLGWLWLLAVTVATTGVIGGRTWSTIPLGYWEPALTGAWFRGVALPEAGIAAGGAFVLGALAALPAARRGDRPAGVAVSGTVGPLLLAASYLLAQPELVTATALEISRQLVAPYAVLAGLAGSGLAVLARPVDRTGPTADRPGVDPSAGPDGPAPVPGQRRDSPDRPTTGPVGDPEPATAAGDAGSPA